MASFAPLQAPKLHKLRLETAAGGSGGGGTQQEAMGDQRGVFDHTAMTVQF